MGPPSVNERQPGRPKQRTRSGVDVCSLLDNLPGIAYRCRWQGQWRMEFLSGGCRGITGYPPRDLIGSAGDAWAQVVHPDDLARTLRKIDRAVLRKTDFHVLYRVRTARTDTVWVLDQGRVSETATDGKVYLEGFISDGTAQRHAEISLSEANQKIDRLTREDPVTGLANRRALAEDMIRTMSFCRRWRHPLALIMTDIDHFKRVNDLYGHLVGDQVLVIFARLLKESSRVEDLVVRFGGEEFLLLLPNTDLAEASALAERLRSGMDAAITPVPTPVTVSFGVTALSRDDTQESFLARADRALYVAKNRGRNRVETVEAEIIVPEWNGQVRGWPF